MSLKFGYVPKYLGFPEEGSDLSCLKMGSMAALQGRALLEEPALPKPGQFSACYFSHVAPFGYFCRLVKSCFRAPHGLSCAKEVRSGAGNESTREAKHERRDSVPKASLVTAARWIHVSCRREGEVQRARPNFWRSLTACSYIVNLLLQPLLRTWD